MLKYLCTAICIILLIVVNALKKKLSKNNLFIIRAILVVLLLEVTIFNVNSYRTDFGGGKYQSFVGEELEKNIEQTLENTQYITINDLNQKVKSIYLKLGNLEKEQVVDYDIYYSDSSTSNRYLASKNYLDEVEKTQYATIALSGNCKSISINVKDSDVTIEEIALNKSVPFTINFVRVILLIAIILVIYSLNVNTFWHEPYQVKHFKQNLALVLIIDVGILLMFWVNHGCANLYESDMYNNNLVKALSRGEVSISDTPDTDKLDNLTDPYDAIERGKLERGKDYIWDAAYFNHKYYVYFGALPAILLMVPYYWITKNLLSSSIVVLIFSILSMPVLVGIVKKIFQKYFQELPFQYLALSSLIMLVGTTLIWINVAPRFYELVTVAGFFFAILGFYLVLCATEKEETISYLKMFLGALSLAAAVACRPTQLFASLLIIPTLLRIFIQTVKQKKNVLKNILVVAIPYSFVAALVMRYNYLRFGNVLEFGEKYQLTINNMKNLAVRWSLLPTGILCNLFGLPTFQGFFPFIHANGNLIDTFGYYYIEDMPGGVFWICPIAFFCFEIFKLWKNCEKKELPKFVTTLIAVGLVFVIFTSLKAGSTGRYLLDFAWIFALARNLYFYGNFEKSKDRRR